MTHPPTSCSRAWRIVRHALQLSTLVIVLAGASAQADEAANLRMAQAMGGSSGGWACFYLEPGYGGAKLCLGAGAVRTNLLAGWRNAISSVRLAPGTVVRLCTRPRLKGRCAFVTRNSPDLGPLNDAAASLVVYGGDPRAL